MYKLFFKTQVFRHKCSLLGTGCLLASGFWVEQVVYSRMCFKTVKGWRVRKMIQGCRFCSLGLKQGRNDINMALNPTKNLRKASTSTNLCVILQSDNCKQPCWNGIQVPHNAIISQKKLKMEILPLLFMQAAVLKWNTCTIKCKTHPQRSWRWKSCHCCSCKQQCWNGTHVPQNAKHTKIQAKDGNPVIVVHELSKCMHDHQDASLSIDSEFTSPNKLPVI